MEDEDIEKERASVQKNLDDAMTALQRYSRIRGIRQSDIAKASVIPARIKAQLDKIDEILRLRIE